jgi:PAS domain S-box-containing protein
MNKKTTWDELEQRIKELESSEVEHKRIEKVLRERVENYQLLIDSANDAIFVLDMTGKFLEVNQTAYERLGYSLEEMLSMTISELDDPKYADGIPERLELIRKQGWAVFESGLVQKNGTIMPVEVNSRLINYKGKKAFLSVIRDITHRRCAEEKLQESKRQSWTTQICPSTSRTLTINIYSSTRNMKCLLMLQMKKYTARMILIFSLNL